MPILGRRRALADPGVVQSRSSPRWGSQRPCCAFASRRPTGDGGPSGFAQAHSSPGSRKPPRSVPCPLTTIFWASAHSKAKGRRPGERSCSESSSEASIDQRRPFAPRALRQTAGVNGQAARTKKRSFFAFHRDFLTFLFFFVNICRKWWVCGELVVGTKK